MRVNKNTWVTTPFSNIGKSQLGKTLDSNKNSGKPYPYLCAYNVGYGTFNLSTIKTILLEDNELEKYLVRKGDLLICEGGETGRCAIWESDDTIYYQNALHRVRFNENINNRFIMRYLHYYKQVGIIDTLSHGRTIKHFTQKGLNRLVFNLPPFEEQCLIASELDALQEVIDGYKEQITDLDVLAQSIFLDTFGDPVTNPKGWEISTIGECCALKSGDSSANKFPKGNIPYLKVADMNLTENKFYIKTSTRFVDGNIKPRVIFPTGSVIFPKRGGAITTGKLAITTLPVICDLNIMAVTPNSNIDSIFLYFTFKQVDFTLLFDGTSVPQINNSDIAPLKIFLPPKGLQQQFAAQVEAIERQKELLRQQLADAEMIMAERMQYYFS